MSYKVKEKKRELLELENDLNNILAKETGKLDNLFNWVAQTISFFREINLGDSLIEGFIDSFDMRIGTSKVGSSKFHFINYGPFRLVREDTIILHTHNPEQYLFKARVAFAAAKRLIINIESEERLIPKTLIEFFSQDSKFSHIESSLKLLEDCYQNKDPDGIYKNSLTLLDSIFDLEQELKGKVLKSKIGYLQSNKNLMDKFGISKEILSALDNNRLIRNWESVHKTIPLKYNIPLQVALGCAYLIIMVLEITMATGEIIKS